MITGDNIAQQLSGAVSPRAREPGCSNHRKSSTERRWHCRGRTMVLGHRTLIMGVLNVTPDSFSDGGEFLDPQRAVAQAWQIADEGADLLDIGGMSSRPGAEETPEREELARVLPVLERLGGAYPLPISVDTYREGVARAALERGAVIINDITALRCDPKMGVVVAETGAGLVLMHMRGTPRTMQLNTHYEDLVSEVRQFFEERMQEAATGGIRAEQVVVDPGIGFGKSVEGNLELLRASGRFRSGSAGVLVGPSRKSFIGKILDRPPQGRLWGTAASVALAIQAGADMIRAHDVAALLEVCRMADAIVRGT